MKYFALILLTLALLACKPEGSSSQAEANTSVPQKEFTFRKDGMLEVFGSDGTRKAEFEIEIVSTVEDRMRGLMNREKIGETQGMLFIHDYSDYHSFWMKDTYLALDMVFIDENDSIVHIAADAVPFSEEIILPDAPALYTLEVLAGVCKSSGIVVGDKVNWKRTQ
ncbi:MAG: DUF192 domain-containing protein [Candidatus Cloacimonetes bacterium]|nr:DUF192 domain-containing protein [Candidatus Cloacimonadota bacterium]